ncbi:MAG: DUF3833 domain-containing protein [Pseudomonadota bacterium]
MTALVILLLAALALVAARTYLADFTAQKPADYAQAGTPAFDLKTHIDGPILCEGVIYGPMGRVVSRFTADFNASWDGETGTMTEHFRYDSGRTQDRVWTLVPGPGGSVKATAPDLVGTGRGKQSGPTLMLSYRIKMPQEAGGHVLDVTDWMYLMENGTIMNRSQFRKFGIKVAELVATMRPSPSKAAQDA